MYNQQSRREFTVPTIQNFKCLQTHVNKQRSEASTDISFSFSWIRSLFAVCNKHLTWVFTASGADSAANCSVTHATRHGSLAKTARAFLLQPTIY